MTTKTFRLSGKAMDRPWHVIDASGRPLGRVASEAASLLMGKHKPTYEPHLAMGDFVIIINAREVGITGNKRSQKIYYRHSGYPGGLKERRLQEQMDRDPRRVIERAVKGMLPSTSLGRELFRHLKVYTGPTHPHEAQVRAGTTKKPRPAASGPPAAVAEDEMPPAREEISAAMPVEEDTAASEALNATTAEAPEVTEAEEADRAEASGTNNEDEQGSE